MTTRRGRQGGFTLAETMVALFILALLSSAGLGLLMGATTSAKQVRDAETVARQIDLAQAFLRNDIGAMTVRARRPDDGFGRPAVLFGGSAPGPGPILSFVRDGWSNPGQQVPRSTLQGVTYELRGAQFIRTASVRPDTVETTPVVERVLLEGVDRVEARFQRGGQWSVRWEGDFAEVYRVIPDLIELTIVFEDQSAFTVAALAGGRG